MLVKFRLTLNIYQYTNISIYLSSNAERTTGLLLRQQEDARHLSRQRAQPRRSLPRDQEIQEKQTRGILQRHQRMEGQEDIHAYAFLHEDKNYDHKLIRFIRHVRFPQLQYLSLNHNELETIEGLCRVWLPCLQSILLSKLTLTKWRITSPISGT